ncbi:MAG TPA: transglutaminase family protein [Polyangiaceae bacterium]|nr:transglutaminase family protein [Polyangiaceae bacterium]
MSRYKILHTTRYEYEALVLHAHHLAYLKPRSMLTQRVDAFTLHVDPVPLMAVALCDYFGNDCHELELLSAHDALTVTCSSLVDLSVPERELGPHEKLTWEAAAQRLASDRELIAFREFCFDSPLVRAHPQLARYAADTFSPERPLLSALLELNRRIHEEFTYDNTVSDVSTPLAKVLQYRRGVCQDFAHLLLGCLRSLGLSGRYVSGYLETLPPRGKPRLVGADASHAWVSAYVPDYGWLDLDPTNGIVPGERHITLAYGRDFSDVSPLRGVVLGGGSHRLSVSVDVEALV